MREGLDLQPRVAALELKTRRWHVLLEDAADARYVPTGHLVFLRQGTLMVVPFDLQRLEVTGQPVPAIASIIQALNIMHDLYNTAAGQFSVSDSGWLVYAVGGIMPDAENSLVWVDQKGGAQPIIPLKAPFFAPRLSPDGQRIAYITLGRECRVWVYDLDRGTANRLTGEGKSLNVTWTPDGKRLVFNWSRSGQTNLYWQAADGSSPMEQLTTSDYSHSPGSFSPDGATLAFLELHPDTIWDIHLLDLRSHRITPFLNSRAYEFYQEFSPDGRWLAVDGGFSASQGSSQELLIIDLQSLKATQSFELRQTPSQIIFGSDGQLLALFEKRTLARDIEGVLLNIETGEQQTISVPTHGWIYGVMSAD